MYYFKKKKKLERLLLFSAGERTGSFLRPGGMQALKRSEAGAHAARPEGTARLEEDPSRDAPRNPASVWLSPGQKGRPGRDAGRHTLEKAMPESGSLHSEEHLVPVVQKVVDFGSRCPEARGPRIPTPGPKWFSGGENEGSCTSPVRQPHDSERRTGEGG